MKVASYIIEGTVSAIVLFWIITNATAFNTITNAVGQTSVGAVQAIWGYK